MMEAELERQKFEFEKQLKLLEHRLKEQELGMRYHQIASTEKIEANKLGDSPERRDQFQSVTTALLDAIKSRRGLPKPPEGAA